MSPRLSVLSLLALATVPACTSLRSTGPVPSTRAAGAYTARVAITGRSTYTGSLQLDAAGADSLRGVMRLTSPITADIILRAVARHDSLVLVGPYTASNGCSGDFRATLSMPTDRTGTGPFELADKCAGKLTGTMTVTR